ncbi:MAG: hypothetical protein EP344_18405 [Bacteroidetes bacterium]|nr:MAG: hypothetical protein EP344_18405 [Bacteroidota bacterium]
MKRFIPVLWLLAWSACTTQVDPTADLPVISYQTDISPIISANCALDSGCHGGNSEEILLLTYDELINNCGVAAGKPHQSDLYKVIRLYTGEKAMPPKPNAPLTDEQIGMIYLWILQGAQDN